MPTSTDYSDLYQPDLGLTIDRIHVTGGYTDSGELHIQLKSDTIDESLMPESAIEYANNLYSSDDTSFELFELTLKINLIIELSKFN